MQLGYSCCSRASSASCWASWPTESIAMLQASLLDRRASGYRLNPRFGRWRCVQYLSLLTVRGLTPPSRGRPAGGPPLTSNVRPRMAGTARSVPAPAINHRAANAGNSKHRSRCLDPMGEACSLQRRCGLSVLRRPAHGRRRVRLHASLVTGLKRLLPAERVGSGMASSSQLEPSSRVAVLGEGFCIVSVVALGRPMRENCIAGLAQLAIPNA